MFYSKIFFINQKGQTFVAMVFLMVLALIIGISVSSRFVSTLRQLTRRDDASRALSIAEAGIENILLKSNDTLEDYINYGSCGNDCITQITDVTGQEIKAEISLSFAGNSEEIFELRGMQGEILQVNLSGYSSNSVISVCWNTNSSIYASYIYKDGSETKSEIYAHNPVGTTYDNYFSEASPDHGFSSCFDVSTLLSPDMLRLKLYNSDSIVYIVPAPGEVIPRQGILIESVGYAGNAVKTVKVLRTEPISPGILDYALYQKSTEEPLSNGLY